MDNTILVKTDENISTLKFIKNEKIIFSSEILIGRNGATYDKKEGDGKTPLRKI